MEAGLLKWVEEHVDLLGWLCKADQDMEYGEIIIHYHKGKITSYDICPRKRVEVEITMKIKKYLKYIIKEDKQY